MNQKLAEIFKEMKQIEPKESLKSLILQKIDLEINRQMKRKLFLSYAGLSISFIAIFPAILKFGVDIFRSEFWKIFSLAFSDFMAVAKSWNEYLYSLGETLPVMHVVAILFPIFAVLVFLNLCFSIRNKIKNVHHLNFKSI